MFLLEIFFSIVEFFITNLPGGIGRRLRGLYYRCRLGGMGSGVIIDCGVKIANPGLVHIGSNTWIDNYVLIIAGTPNRDRGSFVRKKEFDGILEGEVRIGENCHISPFSVVQGHGGVLIKNNCGVAAGCKIYSMSHHHRGSNKFSDGKIFKFSPMAEKDDQSLISSPVVMEDSSALGLNSILLPGSHLGENCWVGAGSIVRGPVSPRSTLSSIHRTAIREIISSHETSQHIMTPDRTNDCD